MNDPATRCSTPETSAHLPMSLHGAADADTRCMHGVERREIDALRAEVARLRSETRSTKVLALAAAGAFALGLVAMTTPANDPAEAADGDVARVIQTKRLEIVDDNGRVTMVASTTPQGGRLDLWNASGNNIARLGSNELGGDFILWNRAGTAAFSAYTQQTGGRVEIGSSAGRVASLVEAGPDGGRLSLANSLGSPVVGAGAFPDGGALRIADRANKDAAVLQATATGGNLSINGVDGALMARVRAGEAGGELDLASKTGAQRVSASANESESVVIALGAAGASRLESDKTGGSVATLNEKGDRLTSLEVNDGGGLLVCRTAGENPVASLGASPSAGKGGLMQVYNAQQSPVFAAAVNAEGAGRLALGTEAGVATMIAESGKDDGGAFSLVRGGKRSIAFVAAPSGGLLNLFSPGGIPLIAIGGTDDATGGAMILRSGEGKDLVRVGVDDKGGGNVVLFNKDASERKTVAGPR